MGNSYSNLDMKKIKDQALILHKSDNGNEIPAVLRCWCAEAGSKSLIYRTNYPQNIFVVLYNLNLELVRFFSYFIHQLQVEGRILFEIQKSILIMIKITWIDNWYALCIACKSFIIISICRIFQETQQNRLPNIPALSAALELVCHILDGSIAWSKALPEPHHTNRNDLLMKGIWKIKKIVTTLAQYQ